MTNECAGWAVWFSLIKQYIRANYFPPPTSLTYYLKGKFAVIDLTINLLATTGSHKFIRMKKTCKGSCKLPLQALANGKTMVRVMPIAGIIHNIS